MNKKGSIIIQMNNGDQLDFYSLPRADRKKLLKKFPELKVKIEAAEAELEAEKEKNGAEF